MIVKKTMDKKLTFKIWVLTLFSSNTAVACRLVFGAIGFIWCLVLITIGHTGSTIEWAIGISAGLMGLETFDLFKKTSNPYQDYYNYGSYSANAGSINQPGNVSKVEPPAHGQELK